MTLAVIPPEYDLQAITNMVQRGEINLHALLELTKRIPDEGELHPELARISSLLTSLNDPKGACKETFTVTKALLAAHNPQENNTHFYTVDSIKQLPSRAHTVAVELRSILNANKPKQVFLSPDAHRQALACAEELQFQLNRLIQLFDDVSRESTINTNALMSRADRNTIIKSVQKAAKDISEVHAWIQKIYINRGAKEYQQLYQPDAPHLIEDVLVMLDSLGPDRTIDPNRHFIRIDGVLVRIKAFKAFTDNISRAAEKLGEDFEQKPHPELAPVIHKIHDALPSQRKILESAQQAFSDAYKILERQYISPRGEMHQRLKTHQKAIDKKPKWKFWK